MPYVFFSETVLALDGFRLSGDRAWLDLVEENVRFYLDHEDSALGLYDEHRDRPSSGWSCHYLMGWRRDPVTQEQTHTNLRTNDVTTSAIIANGIALYALTAREAARLPDELEDRCASTTSAICRFFLGDLKRIAEDPSRSALRQSWQDHDEPLNHAAAFALLLILAGRLVPDPAFTDAAGRLSAYIRSFFTRDDNGCIFWPYRDKPEAHRIVGERYWKSTWVILLVSLAHRSGLCFDLEDVEGIVRAMTTNLVRDGEVYESLARRDGRRLTGEIVEFHRVRSQDRALYRFVNFALAEPLFPGLGHTIWRATLGNPYLREGVLHFDEDRHTALLDGIASWYAPTAATLAFPFLEAAASITDSGRDARIGRTARFGNTTEKANTSMQTGQAKPQQQTNKISMPYRHYYYLKIFADLRRETVSEAIRYLFKNREESSNAWIDRRFAHYDRPPQQFKVDEDLVRVNVESIMKRLESLPVGIRPITDGPYETNVGFYEDSESQAIDIYGYRIFDFKREVENEKIAGIWQLVSDKFPMQMTASQFELYRRTGSQFWRLINDPRERETLPQADQTAMDVGAYVGQRALAMHHCAGNSGRVYAVEVEDENYRMLRKNAEVNKLQNFIPIQEAVDEVARVTELYTRTPRSMAHGLKRFEDIRDPGMMLEPAKTVAVKQIVSKPLDQILKEQGIDQLDVVHISVTGHELPVLRGLKECLPTLRLLRVSCPYRDEEGTPNIETAQEILAEKGFTNFRRHGPALSCEINSGM